MTCFLAAQTLQYVEIGLFGVLQLVYNGGNSQGSRGIMSVFTESYAYFKELQSCALRPNGSNLRFESSM